MHTCDRRRCISNSATRRPVQQRKVKRSKTYVLAEKRAYSPEASFRGVNSTFWYHFGRSGRNVILCPTRVLLGLCAPSSPLTTLRCTFSIYQPSFGVKKGQIGPVRTEELGKYWVYSWEARLIFTLKGVLEAPKIL